MSNLFLELYMETLPLNAGKQIFQQLMTNLAQKLQEVQVWDKHSIEGGYTCNRVVISLQNLPTEIQGRTVSIKGPKITANDHAVSGFLRKYHLNNLQALKIKDDYYYFKQTISRISTLAWLQNNLPEIIIKSLMSNHSMRWENYHINAPRPIRNILCLLNAQVVNFDIAGQSTTNTTYDNQLCYALSPVIDRWQTYQEFLKSMNICLNYDTRMEMIKEQCSDLGIINWQIPANEMWLKFSAEFTENPLVISWPISSSLPSGIINLILYSQQKCLWLPQKNLCLFVISNRFNVSDRLQHKKQIKKITAQYALSTEYRIRDVEHVLKQDLHLSWQDLHDCWSQVIVHPQLGNVQDKVNRLQITLNIFLQTLLNNATNQKYLEKILPQVPWHDDKKWKQWLLVILHIQKIEVGMSITKELIDVQGQAGYYLIQENSDLISSIFAKLAINKVDISLIQYLNSKQFFQEQQYWQRLINIVDIMDTLVGLWYHGVFATGSCDPFAQRRKINSLIDNIFTFPICIPLTDIIKCAVVQYDINISDDDVRITEWVKYLQDRVRYGLEKRQASWYWRVSHIFQNTLRINYNYLVEKITKEDNLVILFHQLQLYFELHVKNFNTDKIYKRLQNIIKQCNTKYGIDYTKNDIKVTWLKYQKFYEGKCFDMCSDIDLMEKLNNGLWQDLRKKVISRPLNGDLLPDINTLNLSWLQTLYNISNDQWQSMSAQQVLSIMINVLNRILNFIEVFLDNVLVDNDNIHIRRLNLNILVEAYNVLNFALGIDK